MRKYLILTLIILSACSQNINDEQVCEAIKSSQLERIICEHITEMSYLVNKVPCTSEANEETLKYADIKDLLIEIYFLTTKGESKMCISTATSPSIFLDGFKIVNYQKGYCYFGGYIILFDDMDSIGRRFYDSSKLLIDTANSFENLKGCYDTSTEVLFIHESIYKINDTTLELIGKKIIPNIRKQ